MKRIICTLLITVLIVVTTGCQNSDKHKNTPVSQVSGGNIIDIYCPEGNKIVKSGTKYQLKQPDSTTPSVEEVMTAIIKESDGKIPSYTYMLDTRNNVYLELTLESGNYSKEDYLLIMAAVVNTVFQIHDIESISISMMDDMGEIVAEDLFMSNSFYFYDYPMDENYNVTDVTIYLANKEGTGLLKSETNIFYESNVSLEENIVLFLASEGTIPSNTEVNSVSVSAGICYLDLNSNFEKNVTNKKSDVVLYSVVNSITSLENIEKVQILIDGEFVSNYRKTVDTASPLIFNDELVE